MRVEEHGHCLFALVDVDVHVQHYFSGFSARVEERGRRRRRLAFLAMAYEEHVADEVDEAAVL